MTTHALPENPSTLRVKAPSGAQGVRPPADRAGVLALAAPLLLFAHGILRWVDTLTTLVDPGATPPHTTLEYAAGSIGVVATVVLLASIAAFAWLALEVLRHPEMSQRLSVGRLIVAAVGVVMIALPLGLLPLGALLVLTGLAPFSHHAGA